MMGSVKEMVLVDVELECVWKVVMNAVEKVERIVEEDVKKVVDDYRGVELDNVGVLKLHEWVFIYS